MKLKHHNKNLAGLALAGLLALTSMTVSGSALADTNYQSADDFVKEALGQTPSVAFMWLTPKLQDGIRAVLGHPYPQARVRYWRTGDTTVWILDEIGKEYPITAGFAIKKGQIVRANLLTYREARGGEIHLRSFLDQFAGAGLASDNKLNQPIDGIAGATLSVDAMQRMARTALYLSENLP